MPPSICVIEVGCKGLEEGDGLGQVEGCVMHLVTPETRETTHYFWAFVRHFRPDDAALTDYIRTNVAATHHEDKVVIELQHRCLTAAQRDNPVALAIGVDAGPIRGRRQLEGLIAAERGARVAA
jgi:vanillate O-demethylase monooxygenase subunit